MTLPNSVENCMVSIPFLRQRRPVELSDMTEVPSTLEHHGFEQRRSAYVGFVSEHRGPFQAWVSHLQIQPTLDGKFFAFPTTDSQRCIKSAVFNPRLVGFAPSTGRVES